VEERNVATLGLLSVLGEKQKPRSEEGAVGAENRFQGLAVGMTPARPETGKAGHEGEAVRRMVRIREPRAGHDTHEGGAPRPAKISKTAAK
jgi:hypothetical protein